MKQFTLRFKEDSQRPSFVINNGVVAMLDTGALYPVWTKSEYALIKLLNAKSLKRIVPVSGFGGTTMGKSFRVPYLQIGELIYSDICVVACPGMEKVPFSIILSSTMFQGLIYEIDTVNNCFNIAVPEKESVVRNCKILDENNAMRILCQSQNE